jgi:hypothetical protein
LLPGLDHVKRDAPSQSMRLRLSCLMSSTTPSATKNSADLERLQVERAGCDRPDGWRDLFDLASLGQGEGRRTTTAALGAKESNPSSLKSRPIHVVFEAAALELAAIALGTQAIQVEDWDVHFMAPGRRGPFLVQAEAMSGYGERVLVRLTLIDEGPTAR